MSDRRWYFVRNVVGILGATHEPRGAAVPRADAAARATRACGARRSARSPASATRSPTRCSSPRCADDDAGNVQLAARYLGVAQGRAGRSRRSRRSRAARARQPRRRAAHRGDRGARPDRRARRRAPVLEASRGSAGSLARGATRGRARAAAAAAALGGDDGRRGGRCRRERRADERPARSRPRPAGCPRVVYSCGQLQARPRAARALLRRAARAALLSRRDIPPSARASRACMEVIARSTTRASTSSLTFFEDELLLGEQLLAEESVLFDQLIRDMSRDRREQRHVPARARPPTELERAHADAGGRRRGHRRRWAGSRRRCAAADVAARRDRRPSTVASTRDAGRGRGRREAAQASYRGALELMRDLERLDQVEPGRARPSGCAASCAASSTTCCATGTRCSSSRG